MRREANIRVKILQILNNNGVYIALVLLTLLASIVYGTEFFSYTNISNVLRQNSMIGLMAIGMTLVIITGGIDLSVGATAALAGILAAMLVPSGLFPAVIVPVLAGGVIGLINGFVITRLNIVPFIGTLAVQMAVRGVAYIITSIQSIAVPEDAVSFTMLGRGYIFYIPIPIIVFFFIAFIIGILSIKSGFGRSIFAIGGNENAAKMMGLSVKRNVVICYMITGGLSALAGVILASRLGAGQPVSADGWEMDAIAAVAIGGTLLTGGVGSVGKTVCGVLVLGVIKNIINLQGTINSYWQKIIMGLILLLVIIVQRYMKRTNTGKKVS